MKCPKCGIDNSSSFIHTVGGQHCAACETYWTEWQQAEIEALKAENERLQKTINNLEKWNADYKIGADEDEKLIESLRAELAKHKLKWQTGRPPKDAELYRAKKHIHDEDYGFGVYDKDDGLICGTSGTWCIDPIKEKWAGPIPEPEDA